ncbi:hypothetical protein CLAIMM_06831 [Cladophialophora immunda]|nr:hypothetical protein CLAIMM_06831 [Cladophialophora immunda]
MWPAGGDRRRAACGLRRVGQHSSVENSANSNRTLKLCRHPTGRGMPALTAAFLLPSSLDALGSPDSSDPRLLWVLNQPPVGRPEEGGKRRVQLNMN